MGLVPQNGNPFFARCQAHDGGTFPCLRGSGPELRERDFMNEVYPSWSGAGVGVYLKGKVIISLKLGRDEDSWA
jgi:hypothetical protein